MRVLLTLTFLFLLSSSAWAQYWFGPKVGISYIDHVYQESTYESDSFNVNPDFNFQFGAAFSYTASDKYAVYGELLYERVDKSLKDIPTNGDFVTASMRNHFISVPIMLRITLGRVPFHYYVNGGPRLSYWVAGSGTHDLESFSEPAPNGRDAEGNALPVDYRIKFRSNDAAPGNFSTAYVAEPNRVQFGLALGGGVLFDLYGGSRLAIDFRYTWVHSNMGVNSPDDTNLVRGSTGDADYYRENLEYYHNIATLGVAYMFQYDSKLKRKGKSTVKETNEKKGKRINNKRKK